MDGLTGFFPSIFILSALALTILHRFLISSFLFLLTTFSILLEFLVFLLCLFSPAFFLRKLFLVLSNLLLKCTPFIRDPFVEVSDELAAEMAQWERTESTQRRKVYRYHANYSLDWGDEIGRHVIFRVVAPDEYYEKRVTTEQLYAAMNALSTKQRRRIYAHYILKIPQSEIARLDGVDHRTVNISIQRGLHNLERYLKNIF